MKALRYYESLGLVTPTRLRNGYRDYSEDDVRLVREVRLLNELGIPVERTRPFVECLATGQEHADNCPASLAAYRDAIAELTERIEALATKRTILAAQLRRAACRTSSVPERDDSNEMIADLRDLPVALPKPLDDGASDYLVGRPVPHLGLPSTAGESVALHELGPGLTILYLYPLTGRPGADLPDGWVNIPGARGCTAEACGFRDHHDELLDAGACRVFGVSSQDSDYQREVVERLRLPFTMLSDTDLNLAEQLDLPTFRIGDLTLFKRLTLVIRDGVVEHVFYPIFPPNEHAQQVLVWLQSRPTPPGE